MRRDFPERMKELLKQVWEFLKVTVGGLLMLIVTLGEIIVEIVIEILYRFSQWLENSAWPFLKTNIPRAASAAIDVSILSINIASVTLLTVVQFLKNRL